MRKRETRCENGQLLVGEKRKKVQGKCLTLNEEGLVQGMRRVSYQGNIWKVKDHAGVKREKNRIFQSRGCRVGITGSEIIRSDPQALHVQSEQLHATSPNDPLFSPESRRNYVSKNSTHSFGWNRGKRDERHRRGAPHPRV